MGPEDYQNALDAIRPDSGAPEPVKAAARRLLERYSSVLAGDQLKNRTAENAIGEHPMLELPSGGTSAEGGDALAQGIQPQLDPLEKERRIQQSNNPAVARALGLTEQGGGPISMNLENKLPLHQGENASLPNASKRADLNTPPEFHPPTPVNPSTPFDSVWGKLNAVKQAMPDWAGGGTEYFVEPSIEQFQHEMAPVLGPGVMHVQPNDQTFREYADAKYKAAFDKAQAEGRGIVRDAFVKTSGRDAIPGALTKAGQVANSAVIGADEAITGGLGGTYLEAVDPFGDKPLPTSMGDFKRAQQSKEQQAAYSPVAREAGFALGVLNPEAIGNVAAEKVGNVAGAGAGAFAGAGATTLANDAPGVAFGDTSARDAIRNALSAGALGVPFGIAGGALGAAGREEGATLRESTPLGEAESGGARLRTVRGLDKGQANRGLEARARAEGVGETYNPDVPGMLAGDLREPFANRIRTKDLELKGQAGPIKEFEHAFAGERIPLKKTIQAVLDAKKDLVLSDGTVTDPARMKQLDNFLAQILDVQAQAHAPAPIDPERVAQLDRAIELHGVDAMAPENFKRDVEQLSTPTRPITPQAAVETPRATGDTQVDLFGPFSGGMPTMQEGIAAGGAGERLRTLHEARAANPNTFDITPSEAASRGLDVGEGNFARLSPKVRNPEDLKKITEDVQANHKPGKEEPFPHFDEIKRALHQDRDAFTGETNTIKQSQTFTLPNGETVRGYSAANAQLSHDIGEFDNLLDLLGLKKMPAEGDTAQFANMENRARNYGKAGRQPEIDRALRQFAAETGMEPTLENIRRYRAMKELEDMSSLGKAVRPWSNPTATRLRLDPALQALVPYLENAGSLGAVPGEADRARQLPPRADEPTIEQIQRLLQP
jgi:hypothetical protein